MPRKQPPTNPFTFGPLALDDAFTDRETELAELVSDMRNGQDVVLYAPRRYGKSSLVLRAAEEAQSKRALVGYCDLLRITTKERFAAALAKTIHRDVDSLAGEALQRASELFRNLRVRPTMELDPDDGAVSFSFRAAARRTDIDDTIEQLLELLGRIAAERKRRVVMIFDEFQEVVELDPKLPNIMRSVFQTQPEVAHVYLGSKRHVLDRIFNDANEPFWRSAKKLELGLIPAAKFARFIRTRFQRTGKSISDETLNSLLETTRGHPYATQELAYSLWEAGDDDVDAAIAKVVRSEHNHLESVWDDASPAQRQLLEALADESARAPYSEDYRRAHDLPGPSTLQAAIEALENDDVIGRLEDGTLAIIEPFFAAWINRP